MAKKVPGLTPEEARLLEEAGELVKDGKLYTKAADAAKEPDTAEVKESE